MNNIQEFLIDKIKKFIKFTIIILSLLFLIFISRVLGVDSISKPYYSVTLLDNSGEIIISYDSVPNIIYNSGCIEFNDKSGNKIITNSVYIIKLYGDK